jgi:hypothetical protein
VAPIVCYGISPMAQSSVEILIGKLATDEEFRERFALDREKTLADFAAKGHELTRAELAALLATDVDRCARFAAGIDPRLQKASLRERFCPFGNERRRG